jgi:hypothetical protein
MPLTESSRKNIKNARGFILAMLLLVLVAAFHLMLTSNKVKVSLQVPASAETLQAKLQRAAFFCQAEQLALTRYLFDGDVAQLKQLELAQNLFHQIDAGENRSLKDLVKLEADWYRSAAQPLIAQRKALDAGHGTLAELEVRYFQVGGTGWEQRLSQLSAYTGPEMAPAAFGVLRQRLSESLNARVGVGVALCLWLCWWLFSDSAVSRVLKKRCTKRDPDKAAEDHRPYFQDLRDSIGRLSSPQPLARDCDRNHYELIPQL